MLVRSVLDLIGNTPLLKLPFISNSLHRNIYIKLESYNPGGSMKDRIALYCIEKAEKRGDLQPGSTIIESTSGSLGVGLSIVGRQKGYKVLCVVDPKITAENATLIQHLGSTLVTVNEPDNYGSYLSARINLVQRLLRDTAGGWWFCQYENSDVPDAYAETLAKEIDSALPSIDWIVAPIGTGGLLAGLAKYFNAPNGHTKILGIDAQGSVALGGSPGPRKQIGIGSSERSRQLRPEQLNALEYVDDLSAIEYCYRLASEDQLMLGWSTGSVLAGLLKFINKTKTNDTIVLVSPDSGIKYSQSIYSASWVESSIKSYK